jgi:hypothetical protein
MACEHSPIALSPVKPYAASAISRRAMKSSTPIAVGKCRATSTCLQRDRVAEVHGLGLIASAGLAGLKQEQACLLVLFFGTVAVLAAGLACIICHPPQTAKCNSCLGPHQIQMQKLLSPHQIANAPDIWVHIKSQCSSCLGPHLDPDATAVSAHIRRPTKLAKCNSCYESTPDHQETFYQAVRLRAWGI